MSPGDILIETNVHCPRHTYQRTPGNIHDARDRQVRLEESNLTCVRKMGVGQNDTLSVVCHLSSQSPAIGAKSYGVSVGSG